MAPYGLRQVISWSPSRNPDEKFSYANPLRNVRNGAFRVVEIEPLLEDRIEIWEFREIRWNKKPDKKLARLCLKKTSCTYVAISHVWGTSKEVKADLEASRQRGTGITVVTANNPPEYHLSWDGLKDVARAIRSSSQLGRCRFVWLDLLCLNQTNNEDKTDQIRIMAEVYKNSRSVIIMIGGIPSVPFAHRPTAWMDRAWTLQEAILNWKYTYVYLKWNVKYDNTFSQRMEDGSTREWSLEEIPSEMAPENYKLVLIKLADLLDLADQNRDPKTARYPNIRVLDGVTGRPGAVPRRALRAAISRNKRIRVVGIFRSMYLRTSCRPCDLVYVTINCFKYVAELDVPIDPYRQNRSPLFLWNDLCRKMATYSKGFELGWPAFLAIGGVEGSSIPYQPQSLLPVFPHEEQAGEYVANNLPPQLTVGGTTEWVGKHVADSPYYIAKYDVRFITHSFPHIVNVAA